MSCHVEPVESRRELYCLGEDKALERFKARISVGSMSSTTSPTNMTELSLYELYQLRKLVNLHAFSASYNVLWNWLHLQGVPYIRRITKWAASALLTLALNTHCRSLLFISILSIWGTSVLWDNFQRKGSFYERVDRELQTTETEDCQSRDHWLRPESRSNHNLC